MQNSIYIAESDFLNDESLFHLYYDQQSDWRKTKTDKLNNRESKNNCLLAGILLNKLIKENGIESYEIKLSENGKPYEKNNRFWFSISHSTNIVAVAISDRPVGLDLEINSPKIKTNISDRFFSETDRRKIQNNEMSFLQIWTRKESYTKLKDENLINVLKTPDDETVFFNTTIEDKYTLSVCTKDRTEFKIALLTEFSDV